MILDNLANAHLYLALHPRFKAAFEFIQSQDLQAIEVGKYPIDGTNIHAIVSSKEGNPAEQAKFEAHENYLDIQVCISGTETIGWSKKQSCTQPKDAYNPEKDVIFFADTPSRYFQLHANDFTIFYPTDVHAPMIGEGVIKKLVVKIKIAE